MPSRAEPIEALLDRARALSRSEPAKAYRLARRALALIERSPEDIDQRATALRVSVQLAFEQQHLAEAARLQSTLEDLLPRCSAAVSARCKNGLGWIAYSRGDLGRALGLISDALSELTALGEIDGELWARNNLASVYSASGFRDRAVALFIENRERSRQLGKKLMEGGALLNLALEHNRMEDFPAALDTAEQCLPLLDAHTDLYAQLMARTQILNALLCLGRVDEARERIDALLATPCPIPTAAAMLRFYHARTLRHQGDFEGAVATAREGLRIIPRTLSPNKLQLWSELALAHEGQGDLTQAWQVISKLLAGAKVLQNEASHIPELETAARLAERRGRTKDALAYYKRLLELQRKVMKAETDKQRVGYAVEVALDRARQDAQQVRERNLVLQEALERDGMTALYNHATFQKMIEQAVVQGPMALLMIDVDDFKQYNDTFGHPAGDTLLKGLANLLQAQLRDEDRLARYGGEEFALLLPRHDAHGALAVAERLRRVVADYSAAHRAVTVSIGVSATPPLPADPLQLVEAADRSLYEAKRRGKNQVVVSDGLVSS